MTAAFIHDHNFVYNPTDGLHYDGSGGVFAGHLWSRYLAIFDRLVVIGRYQASLPNRLVVASAQDVDFHLVHSLPRGLKRYAGVSAIKRDVRTALETVDVAIIRVPSTLGYITQNICIETNKPYVLEVVGCAWDAYWNYGNIAGKLLAPIETYILKQSASKSKSCIYVTQHYLQQKYPTKGKQIGISNVKLDSILDFDSAFAVCKRFIETRDENPIFKIGLIGTFHVRYKGQIEAIRAIDYLVKEKGLKDIRLSLVGTGSFDWIIEEVRRFELEEYVSIIGALESGENGVFSYLDSLNLYIHPSKQEGLPRVVVEALGRGKLCLASSVAGTPELLPPDCLHKPGDWKTLAKQIELIYHNEVSWETMVKTNLDRAKNYIESELQRRRVKFIKECLELHRRSVD